MTPAPARIASVNTGRPREITWEGRRLRSAIWKEPVAGPVAVTRDGVAGDVQVSTEVHGGEFKAVYAYAAEDLAWWAAELGATGDGGLAPGTFGENLTTAGLDVSGALIGERWAAGPVLLEVTGPRIPCHKLGARMGDTGFPRRFAAAERPGAYLRVISEGEVSAGDPLRVVHRPAHGLTVADVSRIRHGERARAAELLDVEGIDPEWVRWAHRRLRERA